MAVLEMENVFPMGFVNVKMDTLELIAQQVIQKIYSKLCAIFALGMCNLMLLLFIYKEQSCLCSK